MQHNQGEELNYVFDYNKVKTESSTSHAWLAILDRIYERFKKQQKEQTYHANLRYIKNSQDYKLIVLSFQKKQKNLVRENCLTKSATLIVTMANIQHEWNIYIIHLTSLTNSGFDKEGTYTIHCFHPPLALIYAIINNNNNKSSFISCILQVQRESTNR